MLKLPSGTEKQAGKAYFSAVLADPMNLEALLKCFSNFRSVVDMEMLRKRIKDEDYFSIAPFDFLDVFLCFQLLFACCFVLFELIHVYG